MPSIVTISGLTAAAARLGLDEVATGPAGNYLRAAYTAYATLAVGDSTVLAAYAKGQDGLDLYRVQGSAPWISYAGTS